MERKYNILIVDDEPSVVFLLKEELSEFPQYSISSVTDGIEAVNLLHINSFDVVLLDVKMPRLSGIEVLKLIREHHPATQVIMLTNYADVKTAIETMKLGAYDFVGKPYIREELLSTIERALERRQLQIDNELMKYELSKKNSSRELVGSSKAILGVVATAKKIAGTDTIVQINGESGSGKELVATLVHQSSRRVNHPFVTINCASIPDALLESELFGHEKGSFTGAVSLKRGLVEVADGGTLFLDEVGDISTAIQPKLLRFLETGEFRRVGGTASLRSDVRIISATNKDLQKEVEAGKFREDLLYRLNVVSIKIPPLRERKDDIPLLIQSFFSSGAKSKSLKRMSEGAMQILMQHDWPGNIRELKHVVEGASILSLTDEITADDLPLDLLHRSKNNSLSIPSMNGKSDLTLEGVERIHIEHLLQKNNFNRTKTSAALGISQKTLYLKIKKFHISVPEE